MSVLPRYWIGRLGALALCSFAIAALAAYPEKPVRLVVPFPAGGTADLLARLMGERMERGLGQRVVVENRQGAGGNIGADVVAKAPADGYTLLLGTVSTHAINPSIYARMPYDALRDFAPITLVATMPNILVTNPQLPVTSVSELVALAKSKPGELTFASAGNGTSQHLSGELFKKVAGIALLHIPYKGNAQAMNDLLGGQVNLMFDNIAVSLPQVRAGRLRALAVTGLKRSAALPQLPTIAEAGYPGFEVRSWFGLFAPAGTPKNIVARLNAVAVTALREASLRARLQRDGMEPGGNTPEQFSAFQRAELTRWAKVVKESGARMD